MKTFLLAFIPLFIAIDPIGNVPLYLGLTENYPLSQKRILIRHAVLTALLIGVIFGSMGHYLLGFIGITPSDFQIGGGILLLILSIREMFGDSTARKADGIPTDKLIGVVPLGIPLIAGPAMMTTLLILHDITTIQMIALALGANLVIAYLILYFADGIVAKVGVTATKAVAKVVAIFLAAIAVMMIRRGVMSILGGL